MKTFHVTDDDTVEYADKGFDAQEYLFVIVNGKIKIQIKAEHEGIVIDTYPIHEVNEPIETAFAFYKDVRGFDKHNKEKNRPFKVTNRYCYEYGTEAFANSSDNLTCLYVEIKNFQIQINLHEEDNSVTIQAYGIDDKRVEPKIVIDIDTPFSKYEL